MGRLFGTDGIRGLANADLSPEVALAVSVAAVHVLADTGGVHHRRPLAVVARDPRASGEMLEAAVVAGLASAGADVLRLGVLPTPGAAYLTGALDADLGVMLSASHNPMPDNGIKLFSAGGHKLPDEVEDAIEARLGEPWQRPTGDAVGRVRDVPDAVERYAEHLLSTISHRFDGLRVVVDCANGAASVVAPLVLRRAGAEVIELAANPTGVNINDGCGSTHPEVLAAAVVESGADLGIAHDGDADRCLAVDSSGALVDGDVILAILALALRERGRLRNDTVATTVMTNLGFRRLMAAHGIRVVTTPVGDRYVLEAMRAQDLAVGGEQSGHLIFLDAATTGDGVLTALQLIDRIVETGRPLADLATLFQRVPQVLINCPVPDRVVADDPAVAAAVADAEAELGDRGRVLVRASGTEPLVRVMVEALDREQADAVAERVAKAVRAAGE